MDDRTLSLSHAVFLLTSATVLREMIKTFPVWKNDFETQKNTITRHMRQNVEYEERRARHLDYSRARQMIKVSEVERRHRRDIENIQLSFSKKDFFDFLEVVWTEAERRATKSLHELSSSQKPIKPYVSFLSLDERRKTTIVNSGASYSVSKKL